MNPAGILAYVLRAAGFAGACTLCLWLFRRITRRTLPWRQEMIFLLKWAYLAALTEIIALRGLDVSGNRPNILYIPLRTLISQAKAGLWPFIYHTVGNLIWFVPLGCILGRRRIWVVLLCGLGASFLLETLQWLLGTGVPDVDDLRLNALGAGLGWGLAKLRPLSDKKVQEGMK